MNRNKTDLDSVIFYVVTSLMVIGILVLMWAAGFRTGRSSVETDPVIITACTQIRGQEQECHE